MHSKNTATDTEHNTNSQQVITANEVSNLENILDKSEIKVPLVAVFCGSKMGNNAIYQQASFELGQALNKNGLGLVYGGASIGLMGTVADGVMKANDNGEVTGTAIGVLPEFMLDYEIAHQNLTRLHLTDTMHTRKAIMAEYADAFVTLPGGVGTLEEIMEIATWRQLEQHTKPTILLNINGYYDRLVDHLHYSVAEGFLKQSDVERLIVCNDVASAIAVIKEYID